MNEFTEKLG